MKIKAAEDLRGELVLGSINKSLTKGKELVIPDDAFWNNDIQLMLKARKIAVVEGGENFPDVANAVEERIAIQSAYRKPIELTGIPFPIKPGQVYSLTLRQVDYESVQQAIALGLIVLCDPDTKPYTPEAPMSEREKLLAQMEEPDEAEKFKATGEAKTITRDRPERPKNTYVYDPVPAKTPTPPNAREYDPNRPAVAQPSNKLPVRGHIKPVGMTQSPIQEEQLKQAQARMDAAPKRIGLLSQQVSSRKAGPKRIRPIGSAGERSGGDDALTCEIL